LACWSGALAGDPPLVAPPAAHDLPGLWAVLAEPDAAQALAAVGHLVAAPQRAIEFLGPRLYPAELTTDQVRRWIAELDDDEFAVRENASRELAAVGSAAAHELSAALARAESPEVRQRLRRLRDLATSPTIARPDELQARRAICVLERIGSEPARRVLSYLAAGALAARQTRYAAEALGRLESRQKLADARKVSAPPQGAGTPTSVAHCLPEMIRSFGTPAAAYQACFSPKEELLATCSGDRQRGQVLLWNLATGDQVRGRMDLPSAATCVCFSPCGRLLAAGGGQVPGNTGGWLSVWDLESGETVLRPPPDLQSIYTVAVSPDGGWLAAAGHDGVIRVWELATGRLALPPLVHPGNPGETITNVFEIAFSPDGARLASCGGANYGASTRGRVCLWDGVTGERLQEIAAHTRPVFSVAFSPCGTRVASASGDQTVRIWDAKTGEAVRTFQAKEPGPPSGPTPRSHAAAVYSVAFSPDGRRLASADSVATWRVWDVATGEQLCAVDKQPAMYRLTFGPDGKTLARTGKTVEWFRLREESR
jgi:WD40 repeat protein